MTPTQFLRFDPAMYTSPGRTYARLGVRDPAHMYVRGRCTYVYMLRARLYYDTCTSTSTSMYIHIRDQNDNATNASTRWVPTVRHFLACEDVAGGSQQSGGKHFFCKIRWPVRWVPAVRWRNNYFARNKEALPCCGRGPSCQPLHVQSTSDGSRSMTTLTRPRREHHGGGRRRGLGRGTTWSRGRRGSGSPRGEEYEGSLVWLRCEADVAAGPGQQWE